MEYLRLLLRNPDFRRLYLADLVSLGGDWFLTVALLDLVLERTGSATLASLMIVCQSLPVFFTMPFAGHLLDRFDRRKLMILVDLIRVVAALLPILVVSTPLLPLAFVAMAVIAAGSAIFQPGASAALPNLVDEEDLARASVLFGSTWGAMLMIGAAAGGLVTMRFGRNTSFVIDAATFLVSAFFLVRIRRPLTLPRETGHPMPSLVAAFRQTFSFARAHPRVLALLTAKGGYGIGAGVVAMLSLFGREVFHAGAFGIGMLFAGRGLGALVGPFLVRAISPTPERQYRTLAPSILLFGIGYLGLAYSPTLWIGVTAAVIAHIGGGAQWLTSTYGLQREVPDSIRGRVFAVDYGLVTLTMSLSSLFAGVAADRLGVVMTTAATAVLEMLWAVVWGVTTWSLWSVAEDD